MCFDDLRYINSTVMTSNQQWLWIYGWIQKTVISEENFKIEILIVFLCPKKDKQEIYVTLWTLSAIGWRS